MSANVKTDYIFSSTDTPRAGNSRKARRAIEAVREAVRVSKTLDTSNIGISMPSEATVLQAVTTYFSEPQFAAFSIHPEYEIQIGAARYRADIVLRDADGNFTAIAECKLVNDSNHGLEQLKGFLCATDAPFGILASGINRKSWHFYENLRHNRFKPIKQSDFETRVLEGLKKPTVGELMM